MSFDTDFSSDATTDAGSARTTTNGSDGGWQDAGGSAVSELGHVYFVTLANLGICNPELPFCTTQPGWGFSNTGPFTNIQTNEDYWTGTALSPGANQSWYFSAAGQQRLISPDFGRYAWAVYAGDVLIDTIFLDGFEP